VEQSTLWANAETSRDDALVQVEENAEPDWSEQAYLALRKTAERKAEFISDDVWAMGLDSTREDRALGPVFRRASREGWIEKTDRVRPSVRSHLSGKPVWRSRIYGGGR
jgi:hypothetical protein